MKHKEKQKLIDIPRAPEKPSEHECCGRGCSPCIFDYYQMALRKWKEQYSIIEGAGDIARSNE